MTELQKIFFGVMLGLLGGAILFMPALDAAIEVNPRYVILYIIYVILIIISVFIYDGRITFGKVIKTTDNDWSDIDHIQWCYNRLKHVHKVENVQDLQWLHDTLIDDHGENRNYDYMIRLRKIINGN